MHHRQRRRVEGLRALLARSAVIKVFELAAIRQMEVVVGWRGLRLLAIAVQMGVLRMKEAVNDMRL